MSAKNGKPNYASWTVLRYFEDVYYPSKVANGRLNRKSGSHYRYSVSILNKVIGRDMKMGGVTPALMDRFAVTLLEDGYAKHQSRRYIWAVKSIVRHWRPDALPTGHGGCQAPQFVDADIAGTLEYVFLSDYLPERTGISSSHTIKQYGRCLRLFGVFIGRPAEPRDLTDKIVGKFLRWLVEVEGVKPTTANGYVKQVKALWNWLAKKRVVDRFPTIEKLKEPEPTPVCWTEGELRKLLAACRDQVGFVGPVLANLFWTAFHLVLWDTGERTGAMLALKWEWLDFKSGFLSVPGEFRKGRQKSMTYPLKPATIAALKAIRSPQRVLIFDLGVKFNAGNKRKETEADQVDGSARLRHLFYYKYRRLLKDAGLPYVPHKCGPQKLRRSFASFIEAAGGNATKALKHTDRRVTIESYLDPRIAEVEHENAKLFSLDAMDIATVAKV